MSRPNFALYFSPRELAMGKKRKPPTKTVEVVIVKPLTRPTMAEILVMKETRR